MPKYLAIGTMLLFASGIAAARDVHDASPVIEKNTKDGRFGDVASAPEMEIASAGAALALLAGGIIVLRGRKAAKKD